MIARAFDPQKSDYRDIDGDLRARFCGADLTIGDVGGRVDVENDFGATTWQAGRELAQKVDHRVVTQGGSVTLRLGAKLPGVLKVKMFTECGSLRRGRDVEKSLNAWFEESNFQAAEGDTVRRSWTAWTRRRARRATGRGPTGRRH